MVKATWKVFDEMDYLKKLRHGPVLRPNYSLFEYALEKYNIKGTILDIGGGPGVTAELLSKLGKKYSVYNVDPSKHCFNADYPGYHPLMMTLQEAKEKGKIPDNIDAITACTSLHELALSVGKAPKENKKEMFILLKDITERLKENSYFVIVFLEYKKGATEKQIQSHIRLAEQTVGKDHPRHDLLSIPELKSGLEPMKLIESRRLLQTHKYKSQVSKIMWAKLVVFKKVC